MIKIASMVGAPDLETPTLAPYSGDLQQAFKKLNSFGYDGVELMTKCPARLDGEQLRQLLHEYQLTLVGLCTGHAFGEDRLGLVGPDLAVSPEAVERMKEYIDFAAAYLPAGTMVNIGRFRGVGDPARVEESLQGYCRAFQEVADYAQPRQVRLILEPVSRGEVNFVHSSQDGIKIARMVGRSNFGLMLDTYHMYNEDVNLVESIYEAGSLIWHMHFSDSNRRYPGSGQIPFDRVINALNQIGYNGFAGMEIQCWPDPDSAARLSIEHLRQFIPVAN